MKPKRLVPAEPDELPQRVDQACVERAGRGTHAERHQPLGTIIFDVGAKRVDVEPLLAARDRAHAITADAEQMRHGP